MKTMCNHQDSNDTSAISGSQLECAVVCNHVQEFVTTKFTDQQLGMEFPQVDTQNSRGFSSF